MQIEKYGFYLQSFLRDISKLPITRLFPHEQVPVPTLMNYRDPRIPGLAPCVLKHMDIMCTYPLYTGIRTRIPYKVPHVF